MIWKIIISALLGYLIGSVNLSIIISRAKGKDVRQMGSGNAGATNTLRTMGKGIAAVVFLFDIMKGLVPTLILMYAVKDVYMACAYGVLAVIGHCFPLYFGFKGGKGVATAIGILFAIAPIPSVFVLAEFIVILAAFNYVSLASIVAAINLPIFTYFILADTENGVVIFVATIVLALLVVWNHRGNILRIRNGEEHPLFKKKK